MSSNLHVIDNDNISEYHIGKKGLHLNAKGTGRLVMNIISCIRCFNTPSNYSNDN